MNKVFLVFINKKERWGLSPVGRVTAASICLVVFVIVLLNLYGLLAVCDPVDSEFALIEAWVPDFVVQSAVNEFHQKNYKLIICVGGPITIGSDLYDFKNLASLTYNRLRKLGVNESKMVAIETHDVMKDRTYQSALSFLEWALRSDINIKSINIYTLGAHARRSRFLFQKALGGEIKVGVIGVADPTFDPKVWWKYSNGFRTVIDETIAYLYAITYFNLFNAE